MEPNPQEIEDLVTFTEEILNGKLHSHCTSVSALEILILAFLFLQSRDYCDDVSVKLKYLN